MLKGQNLFYLHGVLMYYFFIKSKGENPMDALVADSLQMCAMGSIPNVVIPDEVTISINGLPAVSVNGINPVPDHGTCTAWSAMTLGVQPACIPTIVFPQLLPGAFVVSGMHNHLGQVFNMYLCAYGPITTMTGGFILDIT